MPVRVKWCEWAVVLVLQCIPHLRQQCHNNSHNNVTTTVLQQCHNKSVTTVSQLKICDFSGENFKGFVVL